MNYPDRIKVKVLIENELEEMRGNIEEISEVNKDLLEDLRRLYVELKKLRKEVKKNELSA